MRTWHQIKAMYWECENPRQMGKSTGRPSDRQDCPLFPLLFKLEARLMEPGTGTRYLWSALSAVPARETGRIAGAEKLAGQNNTKWGCNRQPDVFIIETTGQLRNEIDGSIGVLKLRGNSGEDGFLAITLKLLPRFLDKSVRGITVFLREWIGPSVLSICASRNERKLRHS